MVEEKVVRTERKGAVERLERTCILGTQTIACVNVVPSFFVRLFEFASVPCKQENLDKFSRLLYITHLICPKM